MTKIKETKPLTKPDEGMALVNIQFQVPKDIKTEQFATDVKNAITSVVMDHMLKDLAATLSGALTRAKKPTNAKKSKKAKNA